MTRIKRKTRGFTLVEVICASAILCGAVMIVGTAGTQALRGTRLNRLYEMAVSLANRQLTVIDYVGIDSVIESAELEGDSEDLGYSFHWELKTEYQEIDSLYLVTVTVSWLDGNRARSISVDTMFDGVTLAEDTGTQTQ
ncbi:MAG: type II secretion system protein [Planctomycetota bacterium]